MLILQDNRNIAAVFSDVQMPGRLDGIALAQWLARLCPKIKVLLTSGRMVPNNDKSEAWRFLAKPYRLEDMERELRNLLVAHPESSGCEHTRNPLNSMPFFPASPTGASRDPSA